MKHEKNVPWHILAPSAVACDMFLLRASAHPAERFLCHRTKFPMTIRVSKDTLTFIDFCLYLENLTRTGKGYDF